MPLSHKNNINYYSTSETKRKDTLKQWLTGFIEGNGHFNLDRAIMIINHKDIEVLKYIRKTYKIGSIYKNGGNTYHRLIISKKSHVIKLINLINGQLVLDKTNAKFILFLDKFNKKNPYNTMTYLGPACRTLQINSNSSWISGFTDAVEESCFNFTGSNNWNKEEWLNVELPYSFRVRFRFILDQSNEELNLISNVFYVGSNKSQKKVINYFDNFPLRSSKYRDYLKWKKLWLKFYVNKEHLKLIERSKIRSIMKYKI